MAFIPHNRLSLIGDRVIGGEPVETWSVSLNFGGDLANTAASPDHNEDIADVLGTAGWTGTPVGIKNFNCTQTRLLGFKWNAINTLGHYVNPTEPNTYLFETPVAGAAGGTPSKVPQTAMVASLYTDLSGRRYRGRIYWPTDTISIGNDWTVPTGAGQPVNSVANQTVALIDALNSLFAGFSEDSPGVCIVASSFGVNTPVTHVRVGNLLDTQRRRRAQLTETYVQVDTA